MDKKDRLKLLYKKIEKEFGKPDLMHAHFTGSAYSAAKLKKINERTWNEGEIIMD